MLKKLKSYLDDNVVNISLIYLNIYFDLIAYKH